MGFSRFLFFLKEMYKDIKLRGFGMWGIFSEKEEMGEYS